MLTCEWNSQEGWGQPKITPYQPLSLDPCSSALHYATECFEGMKAYRNWSTGEVRIFRPELNAVRLNKSAARVSLPSFDEQEFVKVLQVLVGLEKRWLACKQDLEATSASTQEDEGDFIYIRPFLIGTGNTLGLSKPVEALFVIVTSRMARYNAQPLKLLASSPAEMVRAWPAGFGNSKVGANYGPSIQWQGYAAQQGYDQVLWLFDEDKKFVTEAGGANFFVVWRAGDKLELVTAPMSSGTVLEGITRRSILELARDRMPELTVIEREFGVQEIIEAARESRLLEAFLCGTAYFVAPVKTIGVDGQDISVPLQFGKSGEYAAKIKQWLMEIMYGDCDHEWGIRVY
ncbi:aminotransferase [Lipomyces oligophaga]|uniref:aminotransferase n=1 Tax=Lipomyces oligophaga TaxID=45792 RepID=UPI0034CEBA0B